MRRKSMYSSGLEKASVLTTIVCGMIKAAEVVIEEPRSVFRERILSLALAVYELKRVEKDPIQLLLTPAAANAFVGEMRGVLSSLDGKKTVPPMAGTTFAHLVEAAMLLQRFDELGGEVALRAAATGLKIVA